MHMIEKKAEKEDTVKGKKGRALEEELGSVKKKEIELESIAQRLIGTADKKDKEAEKQKNAIQMKALLIESNASREKSEKLQKKGHPSSGKRNTGSSETVKGTILRVNLFYVYHFYKLELF